MLLNINEEFKTKLRYEILKKVIGHLNIIQQKKTEVKWKCHKIKCNNKVTDLTIKAEP